jgi:hypothetical protein
MEIKPRKEYVIVKTQGVSGVDFELKITYYMERKYVMEGYAKKHGLTPYTDNYLATGLSYKQAKKMMKLFKEQ